MKIRWLHIPKAFIFTLFAYWQLNDPDALIWVAAYAVLAVLIFLFALRQCHAYAFLIMMIIYVIAAVSYLPELWLWIRNGLPSITGEMSAESPLIEWMREFFGLCICAAISGYYYRRVPRLDQFKNS